MKAQDFNFCVLEDYDGDLGVCRGGLLCVGTEYVDDVVHGGVELIYHFACEAHFNVAEELLDDYIEQL